MTPSPALRVLVSVVLLPAFAVVLGGCPQDDNFTIVGNDNSDGGDQDFAMPGGPDFAGIDFAFPPGTDLLGVDFTVVAPPDLTVLHQDMATAPSTYPQLLIAVDDYSNNGVNTKGRVVRLNLPSLGRAPDLTGNASLPSDMRGVAAYPGKKVLVAGSDTLVLLDATTDSALWHATTNASDQQPPIDALWLQSPSGPVPALAWGDLGSSQPWPTDLMYLDTYDPNTGTIKNHWESNSSTDGNLLTGLSVTGVQQSPFDATQLLLHKSDRNNSWGVEELPAPWAGQRVAGTAYIAPSGLPPNGEIFAMSVVVPAAPINGVQRRLAWIFHDQTGERVYYLNDSSSSLTAMAMAGPIPMCGNASYCAQPDSLYHAVPDPTDTTSFYAICDAPGTGNPQRNVVKMSTAGGCTMVLDAATQLVAQTRPWRMSVAVAP